MMKNCILLMVALLLSNILPAQDTTDVLFLNAFAASDSLVLRWATSSASVYEAGKQNGYLLQRVMRNDSDFVTIDTIRPLSTAQIERTLLVHPDDDAAHLAAYVLQIDLDSLYAGEADPLQAFEQHNNRLVALNLLMLAADLSGTAAEILGARKVLYDYQPEEKAIYRVIALNAERTGIDTAYHYHNGTLSILPPIDEVQFEQEGIRLHVKWDYETYSSFYTAYDVFRAERENGPYHKLTNRPIYTADAEAEFNFLIDTADIGATCHYKIKGHSAFGIQGPASEAFAYRMQDQKVGYTALNAVAKGNHERIELSWEPQTEAASWQQLQGIRIFKANRLDGVYAALHPDFLPISTSAFTDTMIREERMHYYRIVAYNQDGVEKSSSVILADYIDILAPTQPTNLFGYIDSLGLARLIWQPNAERDLDGYRIYKSNRPDGTYYHTHDLLHRDNEFVDTVGLKFLTKKVYYKIAAVDFNNNHSAYSELLVLERPDTIAPVAPRISDYEKTIQQVQLQLIPSSSEDVATTYIQRSCYDKIDTFQLKTGSNIFLDSLFQHLQGTITYRAFAVDDSGNQRGGNSVEVVHHKQVVSIHALNIIKNDAEYVARIRSNLAAGDVLYLYLDADDQPLQFLDRLDHRTTEYQLPTTLNLPFRLAAYVIDREGKKSSTIFSNQITRS